MSRIPIQLSPDAFQKYIEPYLRTAKRGYVCKISIYRVFNYILYRLYTGCQWDALPIAADPLHPEKKEISSDAAAYHFRKWCRDGSLKQVWLNSIDAIAMNPMRSSALPSMAPKYNCAIAAAHNAVKQ